MWWTIIVGVSIVLLLALELQWSVGSAIVVRWWLLCWGGSIRITRAAIVHPLSKCCHDGSWRGGVIAWLFVCNETRFASFVIATLSGVYLAR